MAFRYSGSGWRVAHSIRTFGDQIMDLRGHTNSYPVDGTLGDTAHSNRVSDHNPDGSGIVRALDFFEHETGFVDEVFESMRLARDPRLKYAIHDERMFASYSNSKGPAWEWREYTGVNGHITHGHLSVVADATADQNHLWEINNMSLSQEDKAFITAAIRGDNIDQTDSIWKRYGIRNSAGEVIPLLDAIQFIYRKLEQDAVDGPDLAAVLAAELKKITLKSI